MPLEVEVLNGSSTMAARVKVGQEHALVTATRTCATRNNGVTTKYSHARIRQVAAATTAVEAMAKKNHAQQKVRNATTAGKRGITSVCA